ncbi:MAG: hypothetical protein GXP54_03810 [Deltaproteobacteria bacterium]|nr:hypothetical protein [Deltaproteobacteria bacterium]
MNGNLPFFLALMLGCAGVSAPNDVGQDGAEDAGRAAEDVSEAPTTFYHLEAQFWDGKKFDVDRDLSHKDPSIIFAFGSTHIAPAVSLAMTDDVYDPYFVLTINIGVVKGSAAFPVQCPGPGEYSFGGELPPAVDLFANDLQFSSTSPGSHGALVVTKWTAETGEIFEGNFEGRLGFVTGQPDKYADVKGTFFFTLPEPAGGQ